MNTERRPRYPGYDVMRKRDTPSWDDATREVIDARLAQRNAPSFCNDVQWRALDSLCAVIVPRSRAATREVPASNEGTPTDARRWRPASVPVAALVDMKLLHDGRDGYRDARLPPLRDAWRIGLAALDAESRRAFGAAFADIDEANQRELVTRMQRGELADPAWEGMACDVFFSLRVLHDIASAYYAHPQAWSEIGFGGPANPRGYVRMQANRRDPWEAAEAAPGNEARALEENRRAR
ncbi:gluconate 2-dehydrogenase subunit 3 family protein [Trinickia sp. Y13]|uniref:gluconate 2-dehydrogenase subunit 3 family protein n=1 Tax=Trinickia sp. Y13 TaxID=2917807 RepID=UPI002406649A|nr:gluconate 2-dehydrogenase subunit 3 family protein [Trinickia sp. Y13]MDG0024886.1 gluconate 2-dehydrogenase subunit 3 family protein [Trinickia sp. Y13]